MTFNSAISVAPAFEAGSSNEFANSVQASGGHTEGAEVAEERPIHRVLRVRSPRSQRLRGEQGLAEHRPDADDRVYDPGRIGSLGPRSSLG